MEIERRGGKTFVIQIISFNFAAQKQEGLAWSKDRRALPFRT
jgi:hypothetical protein